LCVWCVCVVCVCGVCVCVFMAAYTGGPTRYRTRLAGGPLLRVATIRRTTDTQYRHALHRHTTDTSRFISHTTNALLFKFRCNIFIVVRIIKEMPGSVASGTLCTVCCSYCCAGPLCDIHFYDTNCIYCVCT
jgi:hypothetical protein